MQSSLIDLSHLKEHIEAARPICLYDFPEREDETDVVYLGGPIDASAVQFLRTAVGGPLAVYLSAEFLDILDIPTFSSLVEESSSASFTLKHLVKTSRKHDPRFAISIDARVNLTGCSPKETARTINLLYNALVQSSTQSTDQLRTSFVEDFVAPGHVPVIKAASGLLKTRQGHAELALTMCKLLGVQQFVVAGELIDRSALESMRLPAARAFATQFRLPLILGNDIITLLSSYE